MMTKSCYTHHQPTGFVAGSVLFLAPEADCRLVVDKTSSCRVLFDESKLENAYLQEQISFDPKKIVTTLFSCLYYNLQVSNRKPA
jgi:hypothetical protein